MLQPRPRLKSLPTLRRTSQAEITWASTQYASTEGGKSGRSTPKVAELESVVASDEASACAGCGQEGLCHGSSAVRAVLAKAAIAAGRCGGTLNLRGGGSRPQGVAGCQLLATAVLRRQVLRQCRKRRGGVVRGGLRRFAAGSACF